MRREHEKLSRDLVVGADGGIQYAVVSITGIAKGKPFADAEAGARPEGLRVPPAHRAGPGRQQRRRSRTPTASCTTSTPTATKNPPLNRAQPKFKKTIDEKFDKPEVVKVTCDAHGWMQGWLIVEDNPYYAVTDEKGTFKLTDVPPGDYEVKVWQEKLGEKTQKVTVQAGRATRP